jgi:hypothetical protein
MIKRFYKINDSLYRGSAPTPEDVVALHDKFDINKIVSLDEDAGEHISRICGLLGITHITIPINANDIAPMANLLNEDLRELLIEGGPTFVHCIQGKDRTGMVIAMYDCRYNGATADEAIKRAKTLGFGVGLPPEITRFYERAIRSYADAEPPEDKHATDDNDADIVDNTRQGKGEWRNSVLDEADMKSFAPGQDPGVREYPYSQVYDYSYDPKMSTRDQPKETPVDLGETSSAPLVGQYDNDAGIRGAGVVENGGGFVNS